MEKRLGIENRLTLKTWSSIFKSHFHITVLYFVKHLFDILAFLTCLPTVFRHFFLPTITFSLHFLAVFFRPSIFAFFRLAHVALTFFGNFFIPLVLPKFSLTCSIPHGAFWESGWHLMMSITSNRVTSLEHLSSAELSGE